MAQPARWWLVFVAAVVFIGIVVIRLWNRDDASSRGDGETVPKNESRQGPSDLQLVASRSIAESEAAFRQLVEREESFSPPSPPSPIDAKAAAGEGEKDPEWEKYPRTGSPFSPIVLGAPATIRDRDLFRHMELNPIDKYIPRDYRKQLTEIVEWFESRFKELVRIKMDMMNKEIDELIAANQAPKISLDAVGVQGSGGERSIRWDAKMFGAKEGEIDTFHTRGQFGYGIRLAQCKRACEVDNYLKYEAQRYGGIIINWFGALGVCPPGQVQKLSRNLSSVR